MKKDASKPNLSRNFVGKLKLDVGARARMRQLFRKADKTKELVENHYYHRPREEQGPNLVAQNDFWLEYARAASEERARRHGLSGIHVGVGRGSR